MNIHPLRPRDHEDAARVAISWLAERHRKGWRSAFEALLDLWRPEGPRDGWQLDEDGMTMVSINAGEWLISRGAIHARGGLREINAYLLGREGPFLTPGPARLDRSTARTAHTPVPRHRRAARRRHDPDRRVRPAGPTAAGA
jgi:hypothetical protein